MNVFDVNEMTMYVCITSYTHRSYLFQIVIRLQFVKALNVKRILNEVNFSSKLRQIGKFPTSDSSARFYDENNDKKFKYNYSDRR